MKSREPVLVHGRDTWDRVNVPETIFRDRVETIRSRMQERDVDLVLVYGRGDQDGHLCYISNLVNKVPLWGLLVAITPSEIALRNERSSRTRPVIERGTWISEIEFVDSVVENIGDLVDQVDEPRIGTVGLDTMPYRQYSDLPEQIDEDRLVNFEDVFWELRRVKSWRERDQVERAGRILRDVHEFVTTEITAPTTETELASQADRIARLRRARDVRVLVSNPQETEPDLRPPEDLPLTPDHPFALYTAGRFGGYWAEYARTYRIDEGDAATMPGAERAFQDTLRSINELSETNTLESRFEAIGDEHDLRLVEHYDLGHGIGLDIEEPPGIERVPSMELTVGQILSIRAVFEDGDGVYHVFNDTVSVEDEVGKCLTGSSPGQ